MSDKHGYCADCGAPTAGRFCTECGTATAPVTEAAPHDTDDVTRMRASGAPQRDDATRASGAAAEPYSFYRTQQDSAADHPAPEQGVTPEPAVAPEPASGASNRGRLIAGGVAVAAVLAAIGVGTMLGRGGDKGPDTPSPVAVSASSSASQGTSSSAASPSSSASSQAPRTTKAPAETTTAAPTAPAPPPATSAPPEPTASQPTSEATFDPQSLPGYVESVTHDGTRYAMTRQGSTVTIYSDDGGRATSVASFHIVGVPDSSPASRTHLELVSLPNCSKPTVVFNAKAKKGSAAFGWDGSGYQAYKAASKEWNMKPIGGDGASIGTFGVSLQGSTVIYRDKEDTTTVKGTRFSSCTGTSGAVDELHADGH